MTEITTPDDLQHDEGTGTYRFHHTGDGAITTDIVLAIADIADRDPLDMEPIYHATSCDLLERFTDGHPEVDGDVAFTYQGFRVLVDSDGGVVIRPLQSQSASVGEQ